MAQFDIDTTGVLSVEDVTADVEAALPADANGTITVFVRHTTAAITVNEAEDRLLEDFVTALDRAVDDEGWAHDELDGNADAHVRAALIGPSVTVPVSDGSLDQGTWQSVLLFECDGPRTRTVDVMTTG